MNTARRFAILAGVFVVLSSMAFADSGVDFSDNGGTLAGTNSGLSLSGSMLIAINGWKGNGLITGDLGSVTFTTGALGSGSLGQGGTFAAGGSFVISGNGTNGVPSGVIFQGNFATPVTWTLTTLANGTHSYTLTCVITGTMAGVSVNGVTVQLSLNTGHGFYTGSMDIAGGNTTIGSVPEPSSLALFGTGALGLFGMMRRKLS